jgi:hypothetical protein
MSYAYYTLTNKDLLKEITKWHISQYIHFPDIFIDIICNEKNINQTKWLLSEKYITPTSLFNQMKPQLINHIHINNIHSFIQYLFFSNNTYKLFLHIFNNYECERNVFLNMDLDNGVHYRYGYHTIPTNFKMYGFQIIKDALLDKNIDPVILEELIYHFKNYYNGIYHNKASGELFIEYLFYKGDSLGSFKYVLDKYEDGRTQFLSSDILDSDYVTGIYNLPSHRHSNLSKIILQKINMLLEYKPTQISSCKFINTLKFNNPPTTLQSSNTDRQIENFCDKPDHNCHIIINTFKDLLPFMKKLN